MNPKQALDLLIAVVSEYKGTLKEHAEFQAAGDIVKKAIEPKTVEPEGEEVEKA